MQSLENHKAGKFEAQLEIQDKEWNRLLQSSSRNTQEEYSFLRKHYQLLREDFHFNLALLEERDRELDRYDVMTAKAVTVERNRQEELSRLRMQVAKLEEEKAEDAEDAVLHRLQLQELKKFMNTEVQRHSEESERLKWDLQQRIEALEGQWSTQRQEMTAAFHRSLMQQEHEYKLKIDEMQSVLMCQDLKIKLLTKQMEGSFQAQLEAKEAVKASEEVCEQIQTQLTQKHQEMEDLIAVKDKRILMLEQEVKQLKSKLQKEKDDYDRKFKKQLSDSLETERILKQRQTHVELEWQKRCEDIKAQNYVDNEQLIEDLTLDRDQTKAELSEREQELQDLTVLLQSVQKERDQATQAHQQTSKEVRHLQEQNNRLQTVVNQMRKDMEDLTHPQVSLQHHYAEAADASTVPTGVLTTDLKKQEVGPVHLESVPSGVLDQSVLLPQLQQDKLHVQQLQLQQQLQHQQALGQTGGHSYRCAKSHSPQLYSRLKQAVSCIAHLNKEKQQLIEMGNCLRAQISAELTAPTKDAKKPELNSSTGKQGDQHECLDVLEHLQYQLTTQELQYLMRQNICRFGEVLPGPTSPSPVLKEAVDVRFQTHQNKDQSVSHRKSIESLGLSTAQLSSGESLHSLTELWKTLDQGLSPSIFSEGEGELSRSTGGGGGGVQMEVNGISAPVHRPPPPQNQQRVNTSTAPAATTRSRSISKIRNYNIKH
ncbi:coiled-coil domain-containing protein 57-like [Sphaeramia orbicularis]|uniref:coiled-coil domain-containing protein 57-like n=1 Tax=Sphaeramia orbicularis TaxID=375764 RepID=UPI00117F3E0A|nr:coiled-coil domain-containing protein 57-like [Sphaeramia orbicularis]